MNGIISIYKERGMTSFDVVAEVRRIFGIRKAGHGGTLDPMAEGILPVFIGDATKAADYCPDNTKQYLAGFQFGLTTDTQDISGKILAVNDQYVSRNKMPMIERLFTGELMQVPPMYSAVKVNGQKLYDLARRGQTVERKPRPITIHELKIRHYEDNRGEMLVTCSKGTYIRTLINDIGDELGVGGVMTSLVRTKSGMFTLENSYRLSELEGMTEQELEAVLMPLEKLYEQLPKANLDEQQTKLFRNGATLDADRIRFDLIYDMGYYIEGADGVFLGIGIIDSNHSLKVVRRFNTKTGSSEPADDSEGNEEKTENVGETGSDAEEKADIGNEAEVGSKADSDSKTDIGNETENGGAAEEQPAEDRAVEQ